MILRKLPSAVLIVAIFFLPARAELTKTGDIIGNMKMLPDKSIQMALHSITCTGLIAEALITVRPTEPHYQEDVDHVGGLAPGESKPIPAWPTPPCPSQTKPAASQP